MDRADAGPDADEADIGFDGTDIGESVTDLSNDDATGAEGIPVDAVDAVETESCSEGDFECLTDGTARKCRGGDWVELGRCFLGCSPSADSCYYPSNIPIETAQEVDNEGLWDVSIGDTDSPVTINSDDGSITGARGTVIREAGEGLLNGIYFSEESQPEDPSKTAGIFVMKSLDIQPGATLVGIGSNPLILLVREGVHIHGTFDVGARSQEEAPVHHGHYVPGPGGFEGGPAGTAGEGLCPGGADGGEDCSEYTSAGGGGGGFGGRGGDGGDGADPDRGCETVYFGGDGGGPCGDDDLIPIFGGSGGGGGGGPPSGPAEPGAGGAGGGALQITSLQFIHVYSSGVIIAPGGGGGGADNEGGGGGGAAAGGAILLESVDVTLDSDSVLATNGGGGGSGDCT